MQHWPNEMVWACNWHDEKESLFLTHYDNNSTKYNNGHWKTIKKHMLSENWQTITFACLD